VLCWIGAAVYGSIRRSVLDLVQDVLGGERWSLMTIQQQAWAMSCILAGNHEMIDDRTKLQTYLEEELRKAFRAGHAAALGRKCIQTSLETLDCDGCDNLVAKVTYRHHKFLCDDCLQAADRKVSAR
jgi:hypothetical protein